MNLPVISPLVRRGGFLVRLLGWGLLAAVLGFFLVLLAFRYWLLPNIEHYREDIAAAISQNAGQRVTIGAISGNWDGLHPHLVLRTVRIYDQEERPALALDRVEGTLSWRSLLYADIRFRKIEIVRPDLRVRRDAAGLIHVAGVAFDLGQTAAESNASDWLLHQHSLIISDARILWQDEQRGAPPLQLTGVGLRLENRGRRHRFGLRATPPRELAAPLDVRGDFTGESLNALEQWRGQLFTQLEYADIAAWRAWLPFPQTLEFNRGSGAVRVWIGVDGAALEKLTADVHLRDVSTRLAHELPELDLTWLQGRVGWKKAGVGYELSTRQLSAAIRGEQTLPPTDFLLQTVPAHDGRAVSGKLNADGLDLGVLMNLAEYLPLGEPVRKRLAELSPRGQIHDLRTQWEGEWPAPAHFNVKGRFANLGMKKFESIPAFSGISGNIDGSERGGTINFNARGVSVELLKVFPEPLVLDTLTGQASWHPLGRDTTEFRFGNVAFANSHAAGILYGSYRSAPDGPGVIDLTGNLTRADASYVGRYTPLILNQPTRDWLAKSVLAGQSNDVRLRLKGDLADFPFNRDHRGIFQVSVRASGGVLDYVPGWPKISNIAADLLFHGSRMEIHASQANILGARLDKVNVQISDMAAPDVMVEISGEADGPTGEFLKFIADSPVQEYTYGVTNGISASGNGKLLLKLAIPLHRLEEVKLVGDYRFIGNQISLDPRLPSLEKMDGRLEFTESAVKVENASARLLGGPVTINSAVQPDGGVRITALGRANLDNVRRLAQGGTAGAMQTWIRYLRGSADWRAVIDLRKKMADVSVESTLQGIASELPAPFAKSAAEAMPLRFERKATEALRDTLNLSYGKLLAAQIIRSRDTDGNWRAERGAISFGPAPLLPEGKTGIWLNGSLPLLDLDQWRNLARNLDEAAPNRQPGARAEPPLDLAGIDLHIGALDFLGRRFDDMALTAALHDDEWRAAVASREVTGNINWHPQGRGKVTARLKNLTIPATAVKPAEPPAAPPEQERELPALDVVADNFVINDKQLGALELLAVQQAQNWRVEKLRIANADSTLTADGIWRSRGLPPRIQVNIKLEASDIGRFLARLGYPDGVKRGSGKLEGMLSWSGSPLSIDYPSLSGNFRLEAARGQFAKLEPGIGKLLGILSLQALPRRITLDFHDVFSEGFGFDDITGHVRISHGVAETDDLKIEGTSAKVAMRGEVDLAAETQNLRVRITPSLGESVSLAGTLLGGPVVGLTAIIVSKVLKDPLDLITSYEYNITGTWSDPVATKVQSQARQPAP